MKFCFTKEFHTIKGTFEECELKQFCSKSEHTDVFRPGSPQIRCHSASNRMRSSTDNAAFSTSPWRRQSDIMGAYLLAPHSFRLADSAVIFIMNNIVSIHHGVR